MKLSLKMLELDKENERFINSYSFDTSEQEIFEYLLEYEMLKDLIIGIQRTGFFQIGEKIIALKTDDSNRYIVLEGNRRVCALKALHGYYSQKFRFEESFLSDSLEIECDIVDSREEVTAYLAARHIQGMQKWKPESRRNFYFKHYIDMKSIDTIERIAGQPASEIKKFIKESLFFDFFKSIVGVKKIDKPTLIYERIKNYSLDLEVISEYSTPNIYEENIIKVKNNIINNNELAIFYKDIYSAIYGEIKLIDSRSINTFKDFKETLSSTDMKGYFPELYRIFSDILQKQSINKFVPYQRKHYDIVGSVSAIHEIIDYSVISNTAKIMIFDSDDVEVDSEDFFSAGIGQYIIKVDQYTFRFEIRDYDNPKIYIKTYEFNDFKISTTIPIDSFITVYDVFGKIVPLSADTVTLKTNSDKLIVTPNKRLLAEQAGTYTASITYRFDDDHTTTEHFTVIAKPNVHSSRIIKSNSFFDFKFIDVSKIISSTQVGKLLSELDSAYSNKNMNIFVSALRSYVELSIEDFLTIVSKTNPSSAWNTQEHDKLITHIINQSEKFFVAVAKKYYRIIKSTQDSRNLKSYFIANLNRSNIRSMEAALNLGAHKSLLTLFEANIIQIQPTILCLVEFLYILEQVGYSEN